MSKDNSEGAIFNFANWLRQRIQLRMFLAGTSELGCNLVLLQGGLTMRGVGTGS